MAGTLLTKLQSAAQADNTAITAANSGFSSVNVPAFSAAFHLAAAKMSESEGYRFTQSTTATPFGYVDTTAQAIYAFRIPYRFSGAPAAKNSLIRLYSDTAHTGTILTIGHNTTNRMDIVEIATGGLNVSSASGSPMVANTDYVLMCLYNTNTNNITIRCFPRGNVTALFEYGGTTLSSTTVSALRFGIGTSSSSAQIDTNDAFAIGYGDWLDRTDLTASPLSTSLSVTPSSSQGAHAITATITATGGTGTALSNSINWGDGTTAGPQTGFVFTKTSTATPGTYTATSSTVNT